MKQRLEQVKLVALLVKALLEGMLGVDKGCM
jgi:hypothetical protein